MTVALKYLPERGTQLLHGLDIVVLTRQLLDDPGTLLPLRLRSLDAIHLVAARRGRHLRRQNAFSRSGSRDHNGVATLGGVLHQFLTSPGRSRVLLNIRRVVPVTIWTIDRLASMPR